MWTEREKKDSDEASLLFNFSCDERVRTDSSKHVCHTFSFVVIFFKTIHIKSAIDSLDPKASFLNLFATS